MLGELAIDYDQTRASQRMGVVWLEQACELGDAVGCSSLGVSYRDGLGQKADADKAIELLDEACELGASLGCYNLAQAYVHGLGVAEDDSRALVLHEKACLQGLAMSCHQVGAMYCEGVGTAVDIPRCKDRLVRACVEGSTEGCASCSHLAAAVYNGDPATAALPPSAAHELFALACERGHAGACANRGIILAEQGELDKAQVLLLDACQAGAEIGCDTLAGLYLLDQLEGLAPAALTQQLQARCHRDDALGCTLIGAMLAEGSGVPVNHAKAALFLEHACELGRSDACFNLGFYLGGDGVMPKDEARSQAFYSRACELGDSDACAQAAHSSPSSRHAP
jgi:hypothetical protein